MYLSVLLPGSRDATAFSNYGRYTGAANLETALAYRKRFVRSLEASIDKTMGHGYKELVDACTLAYDLQGPKAFEVTKKSAAFREAGRAVAAACLNLDVHCIRLFQGVSFGQASWLGETKFTVKPSLHPLQDWIEARVTLGGVVAVKLFAEDFRAGAALSDIAAVNVLLDRVAGKPSRGGDMVKVKAWDEDAERLTCHRYNLNEIASLVFKNEKASGPQLNRILKRVSKRERERVIKAHAERMKACTARVAQEAAGKAAA